MLEKVGHDFGLRMNIEYCAAQGLYWMVYCCAVSLASAFLMEKGYPTAGIGVILAFVFLIGICLQQLVSIKIDNSRNITVIEVIGGLGIVILISLFCSAKTTTVSFACFFWFFLGAVAITVMQPLLNALNFHIEKTKITMNYGLARGMGSLFFFFSSLIAGTLMDKISVNAAIRFAAIVQILFLIDIALIAYELKDKNIKKDVTVYDPFEENSSGMFSIATVKDFISECKMFFVFLIGVVGYYFGHMIVNAFLYQIVLAVGGDASDNGVALAVQAIVELPCMFLFSKLKDRFGTKFLLSAAGIFYCVKIFFTLIATNVAMLNFSMLFQAVSFALFVPGTVTLVHEIMDEKNAVKGQAFLTAAMTLANLLASVIGGIIIGIAGTKIALGLGTIVSIFGAVVSIFALIRINAKKITY